MITMTAPADVGFYQPMVAAITGYASVAMSAWPCTHAAENAGE